jgi:hypothetical protein
MLLRALAATSAEEGWEDERHRRAQKIDVDAIERSSTTKAKHASGDSSVTFGSFRGARGGSRTGSSSAGAAATRDSSSGCGKSEREKERMTLI